MVWPASGFSAQWDSSSAWPTPPCPTASRPACPDWLSPPSPTSSLAGQSLTGYCGSVAGPRAYPAATSVLSYHSAAGKSSATGVVTPMRLAAVSSMPCALGSNSRMWREGSAAPSGVVLAAPPIALLRHAPEKPPIGSDLLSGAHRGSEVTSRESGKGIDNRRRLPLREDQRGDECDCHQADRERLSGGAHFIFLPGPARANERNFQPVLRFGAPLGLFPLGRKARRPILSRQPLPQGFLHLVCALRPQRQQPKPPRLAAATM